MQKTLSATDHKVVEEISSLHDEPSWLRRRRLDAWRLYEDLPLPTRRDEEWRRTDISALSLDRLTPFAPATPIASPAELPRALAGLRDGRSGQGGQLIQRDSQVVFQGLAPELARQGVILTDLHSAARQYPELIKRYFMTEAVPPTEWKYVALHAALWSGGAFLYVPAGVELSVPLRYAVGVGTSRLAVFPHTLIVAEPGSSVTCIDECLSPTRKGLSFSSAVVEILVREGAQVRYVRHQGWGRNVYGFSTVRALLERDSRLHMAIVGLGGRLTKAKIEAVLRAPGASADIVGLSFADADQHFDYSTLQDHVAPHTLSDLLFKSALKDRARLAWYGLTRVHKGAGGSDANQTSRNLLLSDQAKVAPIPVLEIEAYDVARCSHGATVSSVDEEQLYYVMSRGLSRPQASHAIVEGFFRQALERLPADGLRTRVSRALERKLATWARLHSHGGEGYDAGR